MNTATRFARSLKPLYLSIVLVLGLLAEAVAQQAPEAPKPTELPKAQEAPRPAEPAKAPEAAKAPATGEAAKAAKAKGPVRMPSERISVQPTESTKIPSLNGKLILVRMWKPKGDGPFPTLVGCPGGVGDATWNAEMMVQELLDAGIALVDFAPQGRTGSEGVEDENGPTGQDDLKAVIVYTRTLSYVDAKQVAVLTRSFGVSLGVGCLARYPELNVLFLIDIEGPSAISRANRTEEEWTQRWAKTYIADLTVPYLRIQCDVDHAQGESKQHMADLVNGALKGGKCSWVRVNDNPPNIPYDPATPEKYRWEKGTWSRNPDTNVAILKYIKEMFFEKPWAKQANKSKADQPLAESESRETANPRQGERSGA